MSRRRRKAAYTAAAAAAMSDGPLGFGQRVASVPGLIRDTLSGRYDGLGKGRLALMLLALLYIVSPIDVLPEALLTIPGLLDDAAIGAWLVAALFGATTAYRAWDGQLVGERVASSVPSAEQDRVIVGEVIAP